MAFLSSQTPSQFGDADLERMQEYFDNDQILELVAVVSMFGFLTRWDDALKTRVEELPAAKGVQD